MVIGWVADIKKRSRIFSAQTQSSAWRSTQGREAHARFVDYCQGRAPEGYLGAISLIRPRAVKCTGTRTTRAVSCILMRETLCRQHWWRARSQFTWNSTQRICFECVIAVIFVIIKKNVEEELHPFWIPVVNLYLEFDHKDYVVRSRMT